MISLNVKYKNLDSKKEIELILDKPFVVVYGKNGSGKTTFSRSELFEKEYVFNTDFIYKNIYIETTEGAKDDTKTKASFSTLWIGSTIVKLQGELSNFRESSKKISDKYNEKKDQIMAFFNTKKITIVDFSKYESAIDITKYVKPSGISDEDIIRNYKSPTPLKCAIIDDEKLNQSILIYNNNLYVNHLLSQLKENQLLTEIFLDKKDEIKNGLLKDIDSYNTNLDELKKIESSFILKNKSDECNWIKKALELHDKLDKCLFCGKKNISQQKERWREIVDSKLQTQKQELLNKIDDIVKSILLILKDSDYSKIAKNTIDSLKNMQKYFANVKQHIEKSDIVPSSLIFPNIKTDELVISNNQLFNDISDYLFKDFQNEYETLFLLNKKYEESIKNKNDQIIVEMNTNARSISDEINDNLKKLGFEKELKIKVDGRGNDKKYAFGFANHEVEIKNLSDGQKHKLAIAIFFASIKKHGLKGKNIVLDDPVVTLDQRTYHAIKDQIIEIAKQNPNCIVILTHNVSYLYIQLSNIFNNNDLLAITKLYHLLSDSAKELDVNTLNYDDLTLYKKCINEMTKFDEFSIVASLNIRIYRFFLDLYLRMQGIPDNGNPKDEINNLVNFSQKEKEKMNSISLSIEGQARDDNLTNNEVFLLYEQTNEFVKMLKFPQILDENDLNKIMSFKNNNKRDWKYMGDSFLFMIAEWAHLAITGSGTNLLQIKNYICHPRNQLTKSIVGVDLTDSEFKDFV